MCSSLGLTSLGLSKLPGLPGSLFPLADWGSFPSLFYSNKFSISCSSFCPSGTPMIWILECLKISQMFLSLSSFFWILVSSNYSGWMLISSFCSKLLIWVLVSFPSLLVPLFLFSFIFLYFFFHILYFFLSFVTILNEFCEHPDYQCFELCIW